MTDAADALRRARTAHAALLRAKRAEMAAAEAFSQALHDASNAGMSMSAIADALGVSKAAVAKRFRAPRHPATDD